MLPRPFNAFGAGSTRPPWNPRQPAKHKRREGTRRKSAPQENQNFAICSGCRRGRLPVPDRTMVQGRLPCQMMDVLDCLGHSKYRRCRIALLAVRSVPAAADVIVANVVFAGERVFIIPRTFVDRSIFRAATLTVMHTGFHFSLAFHYGKNTSTKLAQIANYSHILLITKRLARIETQFSTELTVNSRPKNQIRQWPIAFQNASLESAADHHYSATRKALSHPDPVNRNQPNLSAQPWLPGAALHSGSHYSGAGHQ
jgi:hypothetical protein